MQVASRRNSSIEADVLQAGSSQVKPHLTHDILALASKSSHLSSLLQQLEGLPAAAAEHRPVKQLFLPPTPGSPSDVLASPQSPATSSTQHGSSHNSSNLTKLSTASTTAHDPLRLLFNMAQYPENSGDTRKSPTSSSWLARRAKWLFRGGKATKVPDNRSTPIQSLQRSRSLSAVPEGPEAPGTETEPPAWVATVLGPHRAAVLANLLNQRSRRPSGTNSPAGASGPPSNSGQLGNTPGGRSGRRPSSGLSAGHSGGLPPPAPMRSALQGAATGSPDTAEAARRQPAHLVLAQGGDGPNSLESDAPPSFSFPVAPQPLPAQQQAPSNAFETAAALATRQGSGRPHAAPAAPAPARGTGGAVPIGAVPVAAPAAGGTRESGAGASSSGWLKRRAKWLFRGRPGAVPQRVSQDEDRGPRRARSFDGSELGRAQLGQSVHGGTAGKPGGAGGPAAGLAGAGPTAQRLEFAPWQATAANRGSTGVQHSQVAKIRAQALGTHRALVIPGGDAVPNFGRSALVGPALNRHHDDNEERFSGGGGI